MTELTGETDMTITFDDAFGLRMPATMSADEVLIRAREATIEVFGWQGTFAAETRRGDYDDDFESIRAILVYERDRAKPLAEVAPHTAEDPDERAAYEMSMEKGGLFTWEERHHVPHYRAMLAAIKRGRELERGA